MPPKTSWAPQTYQKLRDWVPNGDPDLQKAWLEDYLPAVQWMRESGVPTADRFDGIMTIGKRNADKWRWKVILTSQKGIGFPVKIPYLHDFHRKRIQSSKTSSEILTNTSVVKLTQQQPGVAGSRIIGAVIRRNLPGSRAVHHEVKAKMVVLATGGFQGSPDLTSKYLGQGGDNIFVRSNRGSVGDGLKLAIQAGAGTSRGMNTYYGHLLAAPLQAKDVDPKDYLPLAQYRKSNPFLELHFALTRPQKANIAYCSTRPVGDLLTKVRVTRSSTSTLPSKRSAVDSCCSGIFILQEHGKSLWTNSRNLKKARKHA